MRNRFLIKSNINQLHSNGFSVEADANYEWVCVHGLDLPGPYGAWTDKQNRIITQTSVLIDIPYDFPMSPPGVGFGHPERAIHLPYLLFNGGQMKDFYECKHNPWCWFCFQKIDWDRNEDNLLTLIMLVEASISDRIGRAGLWQQSR